ncbi:hypothetical protein [Clostridium cochlearium]|uniref:hypothetical protein n=1 Tax=Clostridium cochlearium TaxID=1494 RepID=UPI00241F7EE9|nr:hypothetical protein [Clostridium cochlearium]MBE6065909.1 hypothetical protein [Clostridium cochlearium]
MVNDIYDDNKILNDAKASLLFEDMEVTKEEIVNALAILRGETTAEKEIERLILKYKSIENV